MTSRKPARRRPAGGAAKTDIYQEVTDRMVRALEAGVTPWRHPWTSAGRPRSMSTRKPYGGVNVWLLSLATQDGGYTSPWWGTYRQISELHGQVRKGEKSAQVTFWKVLDKEGTDADGKAETRHIPMLRQFRVFNAEQADNLPERFYPKPGVAPEPIADPQTVLDNYLSSGNAASLHHDKAGKAYCQPSSDEVHMPPISGHRSAEHYYSTAFHEILHSTGHASRLARPGIVNVANGGFGSHQYGKEELTVQMGASMLLAETGIDTDEVMENSAAYLGSWIATIKEDNKMIIGASAAGQKAADLVMAPTREAEQQAEAELMAA